jgi:hypothetical protein
VELQPWATSPVGITNCKTSSRECPFNAWYFSIFHLNPYKVRLKPQVGYQKEDLKISGNRVGILDVNGRGKHIFTNFTISSI